MSAVRLHAFRTADPRLRTWVRRVLAAVVLLALAVWSTWPLARHFDEFLFVDDPFISAWGLWWTSHSVVHLQNPWWTNHIFSPDGTYLSFHALIPLAGIVLTPFIQLFGAGLVVNVLKLVLPIAGTLTGRAAARELGLDRASAWVAGGLFGFSTILGWRTIFHLNFGFALPFVPLVVLFVVRYGRTNARRDALLAGAMLGLIVMTDPTIALLGAMSAGLYGVIAAIADRRWRMWLRGAAYAFATTALVGLPQLAMMIRAATNGGYKPNNQALAATWVGADTNLVTMFSPARVRTAVPGHLENLAYRHPWGEATPTYGWGALALALAALVLLAVARVGRRRGTAAPAATSPPPGAPRGRTIVWCVVLFVVATVFALGPELTVAGHAAVPLPVHRYGQTLSGLMPYTWMTRLPFFADVRVPSRFTMLGMFPLAVLAGAGFGMLRARGRLTTALAGVALLFALLECGFPDGGAAKRWVPMHRDRLYAPIKADHSGSTVVDVPLGFLGATVGAGASHSNEGMFRATQHGHPIAGGYMTRLTQSTLAQSVAHPFYAHLLGMQAVAGPPVPGQPPPAEPPAPVVDPAADHADAARLHVGWAVVWPDANRRVLTYLGQVGFRKVLEDHGIVLARRVR